MFTAPDTFFLIRGLSSPSYGSPRFPGFTSSNPVLGERIADELPKAFVWAHRVLANAAPLLAKRFREAVPRHFRDAAPPRAPRGWVAISPPRRTIAYGFLSFTSRRTAAQFPYGQKAVFLIFAEQEHTRPSQAHAAFGRENHTAKEAHQDLPAEHDPERNIRGALTPKCGTEPTRLENCYACAEGRRRLKAASTRGDTR